MRYRPVNKSADRPAGPDRDNKRAVIRPMWPEPVFATTRRSYDGPTLEKGALMQITNPTSAML